MGYQRGQTRQGLAAGRGAGFTRSEVGAVEGLGAGNEQF